MVLFSLSSSCSFRGECCRQVDECVSTGRQWSSPAQRLSGEAQGRFAAQQWATGEETSGKHTAWTSQHQHETSCFIELPEQDQWWHFSDPRERQLQGEPRPELQHRGPLQRKMSLCHWRHQQQLLQTKTLLLDQQNQTQRHFTKSNSCCTFEWLIFSLPWWLSIVAKTKIPPNIFRKYCCECTLSHLLVEPVHMTVSPHVWLFVFLMKCSPCAMYCFSCQDFYFWILPNVKKNMTVSLGSVIDTVLVITVKLLFLSLYTCLLRLFLRWW